MSLKLTYVEADISNLFVFVYLILAVLSLPCFVQAFSGCVQQRVFFIAVHELLTEVVSLVEQML